MKILRKGDVFVKMKDSNLNELKEITNKISMGWKYSSKNDYKNFNGGTKSVQVEQVSDDVKEVKKSKTKTKNNGLLTH